LSKNEQAYTLAKSRLVGNPNTYKPQKSGSKQFYSELQPRLPNTKYEGTSFADAIENNSPKYRNEQGELQRIAIRKELPNVYAFGNTSHSALGINKTAVKDKKNPNRQAAAVSLTAPDVDLKISGHKYQNISDHRKQAHHLISISLHGGALEHRSPESKQYIVNELAKDGFFLGDDRRNYVGLYGNQIMADSGEMMHIPVIDDHQGGVHRKDTITHKIAKEYLPTREEFHKLTDDEVIDVLKLSGAAARADLQDIKYIAKPARDKTEKLLQRQLAKVAAQKRMMSRQLPM